MKYSLSEKYNTPQFNIRMMGPNPIKLEEELLHGNRIPQGAIVMDLGSGQGVTSVFLVREYGFRVYATDLWTDPSVNLRFFEEAGISREQLIPIHADANELPYAHEFFDAIVSTDSYHYFGRDPAFLGEKLLPYVRHGGYIYIAIPGMKRDCHENLPEEMLLSWTPEDLETIHDAAYWRRMVEQTDGAEVCKVCEMESMDEVWSDWLACDNEYARGDRKAMNAGAGKYLNFVKIVLRRK
ncbi:MAG: class I SAM-dependent methyltransferase [Clostridiaceae bacterium]|nr:class I SAM-dependent methyltransferase [Clostridiaceae bacterium]